MGGENWSLTPKTCDSCKTAPAAVFCCPDSAFLCITCDGRVHAANKLASRHPRVWMCHVCEQAPATVTCKADAAALCDNCDGDIHTANPLARRHHRLPIVPFYDAVKSSRPTEAISEEEVEAASWILPDPNTKQAEDSGSSDLFRDVDPYLDLDLISGVQKSGQIIVKELKQYSSDGVVPVEEKNEFGSGQYTDPVVDGFPAYNMECSGSKPAMLSFTSPSISQTVSCSSFDVGLVPDHNTISDTRKDEDAPTRAVGLEREARVLRYKEKRKNRTFNKIVRYASRKAHAETRPRIKGRFAKRSELEADACYGIVPTL